MLKDTNYFVKSALRKVRIENRIPMVRNVIDFETYVSIIWNITCNNNADFEKVKNIFITSMSTLNKSAYSIVQDEYNFIIGYNFKGARDFEKIIHITIK